MHSEGGQECSCYCYPKTHSQTGQYGQKICQFNNVIRKTDTCFILNVCDFRGAYICLTIALPKDIA